MNQIKNGIPGYRGFEYQIEATVWVALHTMLESKICREIVVEPNSSEDLELTTAPDEASSTVGLAREFNPRLMIQFKTRSSGPWIKSALAQVIGDGRPCPAGARGPAPRSRPLEYLLKEQNIAYILVTNASLAPEIHCLSTSSLNCDDSELPAGLLDNSLKSSRLELNGRIAILPALTSELIKYRTEDILAKCAKVPHLKIVDCVTALRGQIRGRLLGNLAREFTLCNLKSIVAIHGGAFEDYPLKSYNPPQDIAKIESSLSLRNVLVLIGPPGIGKSSLAEYLAWRYRNSSPPFMIYRERINASEIEHRLQEPGPALFVISDPWGVSDKKMDTAMTHELSRIVGLSSSDKRFIITSRSDVFESVSPKAKEILSSFVVPLLLESYDEPSLWEIATHHFRDMPNALSVALAFRSQILSELKTPAELSMFGKLLAETSPDILWEWSAALTYQVFPDQPWTAIHPQYGDPMELIQKAGSIVTGGYVKEILLGLSIQIDYVAASWVLFESFESISEEEFRLWLELVTPSSRGALRPEQFISVLKENRIAQDRVDSLFIHSFALKGMRDFLEPFKEDVLAAIELMVLRFINRDSVTNPIGALEKVMVIIETWGNWAGHDSRDFGDCISSVDKVFEDLFLNISDDNEFIYAVCLAGGWPHPQNPLVKFIALWAADATWHPPKLPATFIAEVIASNIAFRFLPRFVKAVIPNISIDYGHDIPAFVDFICQFKVDLLSETKSALDLICDKKYVDRGIYYPSDEQVDLNLEPLKALFYALSGTEYPEPSFQAAPDWEL